VIDEVRISSVARSLFNLTIPPDDDEDTVALWHFDELTGQVVYDSAGTNNGILGSSSGPDANDPTWTGPIWVGGRYGNALSFDGNDYVKLPATNNIISTNTFTVETWFKTTVNHPAYGGTEGRLVNLHRPNPDASSTALALYLEKDQIGLLYRSASAHQWVRYAVNYYDNVWHHIAVTYDGTTYILYYDKQVVATKTDTFSGFGDINASLGTYDVTGRFFKGQLDEVRIWGSALDDYQLDDMTPPEKVENIEDFGLYPAGTQVTASDSGTGVKIISPSTLATGIYPTLDITVTDYALNLKTYTLNNIVVYDPTGGFVTGGGWIESPVNTNYLYMQVGGKATFGFVSKYLKGAIVPTGNTEFQFKAGDLNFKSTSYDWLVVTGSNYARYKGTGTLNGAGEYKFMLWAGDSTETDGADTFRIKIWTESAGVETIVYDNGSDQAIGGGSIVVHTKK
jgi:hypothetical protein